MKRGEPELSSVNPLVGSQVARRAVLSCAPRPYTCVEPHLPISIITGSFLAHRMFLPWSFVHCVPSLLILALSPFHRRTFAAEL